MEVRRYVTVRGHDIFGEWLASLKDREARARVAVRVNRLEVGNFGDCKPLRDGVRELRVHWGPGYRVYYAMDGSDVVLLLCGGDKRRQSADVQRAIEHWKDYQRRTKKP